MAVDISQRANAHRHAAYRRAAGEESAEYETERGWAAMKGMEGGESPLYLNLAWHDWLARRSVHRVWA